MESIATARSKEDIALDLLKFVAATAHVGSKAPGSTGFGAASRQQAGRSGKSAT